MFRCVKLVFVFSVVASSVFARAQLGGTIEDFRSVLGRPAQEEALVRTANFKWNQQSRIGSTVSGVFAIEVAFLDGIACEIAVRSKQPVTAGKLLQLVRPFVRNVTAADFEKPKSDKDGFRIHNLADGTFVSVNKHKGHTVVVMTGACYTRNESVFDKEAAKVRPPTPNH